MGTELEELPLFPLHLVLFPYSQTQLHIFEDRYRDLVNDCVENDKPFGVVLIREGSEVGQHADPYLVGTVVRILKVMKHADGRMDIQVSGERRVRIRQIDESKSYLVGKVEPVVEHCTTTDDDLAIYRQVQDSFSMLIHRLMPKVGVTLKVVIPNNPAELSFTIAGLLPIENLEKQRLLEITSTVERMQGLLPILTHQLIETQSMGGFKRLKSSDLEDWFNPN